MAITKIHAIKSTLGKALAYIENPDKTDGQMLVSGYNCEPQTASIDFEMTAVLAHKARNLKRKRSTNLAYHLIQSFLSEDAVTPEQAHELGKKLAFEYTGGKYEYVVATHIDKGHIHNHIMLNAVSFYDYKKLRTVPYRTVRQVRDISDRLCMEAHLSVIDDPQKIGQLYPENAGKKKSVSNRTEIRKRLNFCLERATDYSQFLSMAKELEITPTIRGKHISYLLEGAGRAVRDDSLSDTDTFTYAGICARLSDNAQEQKYLRKTITGILRSATGMTDFADKLKTAGINTIRKRLSAVKGGRFAMACAPAQVLCVVLSDVLGDPLDMIASGPACADSSTCKDAENVVKKYGLHLSADALACLRKETPKQIDNVTTRITGSVRELCAAAADAAQALGYAPILLTDQLACQAREAGLFLAEIAQTHQHPDKPMAFIAGGETVVKIIGNGKGGRNQELALAASPGISGCNAAVFSVGSDGTDGPTDAAGGYVDGDTLTTLRAAQIDPVDFLNQNDSYTALKAAKGLLFTGPTGTNVNDVAVVLIR